MYNSSWYENLSSTDRSVVHMVMARSLKPPKLSAYGLIDLNINTLGKVRKLPNFDKFIYFFVTDFEGYIFDVLLVD